MKYDEFRLSSEDLQLRSETLLKHIIKCLFVLIIGTIPQAEALETTTVFRAKTEGYNVYRIPAIIRAANSDLLAFCEARVSNDASEIDLVMKRSSDQGKTWQSLQVIQESDDFQHLYPDVPITVGNPAPVVDLLDPKNPGRIWMPFTVENDRVFVVYSDDHGATWSDRKEITQDVKLENWGWYATGPVHSIQLQHGKYQGRLLVPADHRLGDDGADKGPNGIQAFYSDDHGQSWKLGAIDDTYDDGLNSNETAAVELNDGRVYFNTRDQNGKAPGTRGAAYSSSGGESFDLTGDEKYKWISPIVEVLDTPVVQCALLRAASRKQGDENNVILFSGPDENGPTGKGRSDLRLRYSTDETKSWQDGLLIHEGPAAYSDLVKLKTSGQRYGVLFEAGKIGGSAYERIDFATFSLEEAMK